MRTRAAMQHDDIRPLSYSAGEELNAVDGDRLGRCDELRWVQT